MKNRREGSGAIFTEKTYIPLKPIAQSYSIDARKLKEAS